MSTDNFPLAQLAQAHGSNSNYPLLESGSKHEEYVDDDDSGEGNSQHKVYIRPETNDQLFDSAPDPRCRIDNPDFLNCMRGLHGVQRLEASGPLGRLDSSDNALENHSGRFPPPVTHDDKWKLDGTQIAEPGTFRDGMGKYCKALVLFLLSFFYLKRKYLKHFWVHFCQPVLMKYVQPVVSPYIETYRRQRGVEDVDSDDGKSEKKSKKSNRNRKKSREASTSEPMIQQANSTSIAMHSHEKQENVDRSVTFAQDAKQEDGDNHTIVDFSNEAATKFSDLQPPYRFTMPPPMVSSALNVTETILGKCT
jgi:hypothetical protein